MIYKYYIFDVGSANDAIDFNNGMVHDIETISERAAEHHWRQADIDTSWPIELVLVDENKKEYAFHIEMDYLPLFFSAHIDY